MCLSLNSRTLMVRLISEESRVHFGRKTRGQEVNCRSKIKHSSGIDLPSLLNVTGSETGWTDRKKNKSQDALCGVITATNIEKTKTTNRVFEIKFQASIKTNPLPTFHQTTSGWSSQESIEVSGLSHTSPCYNHSLRLTGCSGFKISPTDRIQNRPAAV